ncbi:MAG: hypothetical protein QOD99_953 [Chthoniobacter sp.]|nr:hypothetical protein [Chthoniobacter sp.]
MLFVALVGVTLSMRPIFSQELETRTITLEAAYERALATDQSIGIAYWELRKANLLPWSALTRVGPSVNGRSTLTSSDQSSFSGGHVQNSRTDLGSSGSLTVEQPLIDLTVFPAYRLGKLSARSAWLEHRFTIRGILFGLAQAYYEVLKQQRIVLVNRDTLELAGKQLDISQVRADVGEVTRADVLRAHVVVETARRALIESENLLLLDRNTLANILNLHDDSRFELVEPPNYPTTRLPFDELVGRAYACREDLRVAELAIDEDIARRGEVIGSYGPRLVAQWNGSLSANSGTASSHVNQWGSNLAVQLPFLTGGQREIDLLSANRQIMETRLNRDKTAKQIQQDVKQAWLTVRTLEGTLTALKVQVEAAAQGYEDLQAQYRAGTATSVDVLTALNDLNSARRDLATQTYDYQVALRNLEQVSGVFQQARVERASPR